MATNESCFFIHMNVKELKPKIHMNVHDVLKKFVFYYTRKHKSVKK